MAWSKEDKLAYNKSIVFKQYIQNMEKAALAYSKKVEAALSQDLKSIQDNAKPAAEALKSVENSAKSLKNISLSDDSEIETEQLTPEQELIADLRRLAKEAGLKGNHSEAYKIERAIEEIIDSE